MKQFNKKLSRAGSLLFMMLVVLIQPIYAQQMVSGKVISGDEEEELPGVNVVIKGTNTGTVTDFEGNYSIEVNGAETVLVFSSVGYTSEEITVGNRNTIDLTLYPDITQLSEIVVVGYGTQEKKDVTGSIGSVGPEEFENQPVVRFDQIIQGRAAGVNVTNASGAPGGSTRIRIRGANSINGNNDPLYVVDGFVGANFEDINPADIENIQILKDASATAIYGSRGANGVVLITTKSGTQGEPKLSFTTRYFNSRNLGEYDLMDAATFAEVANERAAALGTNPTFTSQEIADFRANGGTDWQNELYRTATGQEYQLNYSGGNEDMTYFVSGNYLDQDGIVINSYYKRYALRANVRATLAEKLTSSLKVSFIRRENQNTSGDGNTSGPLAGALAWSPTVPVRDANGNLIVRDPVSSIKSNPVEMALNDNINEVNTLLANGALEYELIDGLDLSVGYGISYSNQQNKLFTANAISNNPTAARHSIERIFLQNTNSVTYNKIINSDHNLTVTGVAEFQTQQLDRFNVNVNGLQFPDLKYDNIALVDGANTEAIKEKQTIASYIGRFNYTFKDRYLLTASIRTDGSSKFRGDNRFSTFPALALGWRLSEESFMSGGFFDDLKLRASWGETGSQGIDVFGTVTTFNTNAVDAATSFRNGQLTSGIIIGNPGNAALTWETTQQWNVGVDMQIFNGRLGLTTDYFQKNTTDLLLSEPLPQYSGGGSIFRNLGEVSNKGFEFALSSTVIDNGDFRWTSNFNASFIKNEVVNIGDREQIFADGDAGAGLTNLPEMVIAPGNPLTSFWGLNYLGTWKTGEEGEAATYGNVPGDSKYEDINNDGVIGGDDYQIIGTGIPEQLFGWNNNFDYKNFSLNIFFQSMGGYDKWNFSYATAIMANADAREVTHADIQNRWMANSNEASSIPAFSQSDVSEIQSSRFLEDGSFIRLKNVSLAYNLPRELVNWLDASISISGLNLLTITDYTGIDPEAYSVRGDREAQGSDAGAYPNARTFVVGLNLTF